MLILMTVIVFLQVIFRYFLLQPLHWGEESARFLFVWVALLGIALAVKDRAHFSITMVSSRLPSPIQGVLRVMIAFGATLLFGIMVREGWGLVVLNQIQESPAIGIPMSIPYMAVPTGGVLALIFLWMDLFLRRGEQRLSGPDAGETPVDLGLD